APAQRVQAQAARPAKDDYPAEPMGGSGKSTHPTMAADPVGDHQVTTLDPEAQAIAVDNADAVWTAGVGEGLGNVRLHFGGPFSGCQAPGRSSGAGDTEVQVCVSFGILLRAAGGTRHVVAARSMAGSGAFRWSAWSRYPRCKSRSRQTRLKRSSS